MKCLFHFVFVGRRGARQGGHAAHLPHPVHYTTENQPRRQVKEKLQRRAAAATKPKAAPPQSPRGGNPNRQRAATGASPDTTPNTLAATKRQPPPHPTTHTTHKPQTGKPRRLQRQRPQTRTDLGSKALPWPKRSTPQEHVAGEWVVGGPPTQHKGRRGGAPARLADNTRRWVRRRAHPTRGVGG